MIWPSTILTMFCIIITFKASACLRYSISCFQTCFSRRIVKKLKMGEPDNDVVQKSMGMLGRWHIWVCFWITLVKFPVAWHQLNIIFLAPPANFTCANSHDRCWDQCSEHIFDRSIFTETITTEWDLVCQRDYLAKLAQTITMLGVLVGSVIFGYCSDKFGRKNPLIWAVILQIISSTCVAFSPWLILFFIMRFVSAVTTGGCMITSFVLIMELVGTKWRTTVGILYQIPFNLGHLTLPLLSYFLREWRLFQLSISIPELILIAYIWILPESPRWLLAVGKTDEAVKVMEKAARINNLPTHEIRQDVSNHLRKNVSEKPSAGSTTANVLDLVRTPIIRTYTICMCFNWLVSGLCFFGVAQYMGHLGGNIFLNIAFAASIEIPSTLFSIYTLKAWGRKWTMIFANLFSGLCCILSGVIPEEPTWIVTSLNLLCVFGLMIGLITLFIYCGELFPTVVRNVGLGMAAMCGRIGSMAAPFVAGLVTIYPFLPSLVFGAFLLFGALLCLKLPETLNCNLPDTVEEAEQFELMEAKNNEYNTKC